MHEIRARGLALAAFIWKVVRKVTWLSGLISILRFYYYRFQPINESGQRGSVVEHRPKN